MVDRAVTLTRMDHPAPSLDRLAFSATIHCLTGCGIGEVLGLVISTQLGWHDVPSIALAIVLAFVFGFGLTVRPLLGSGMAVRAALGLAFAADALSITVMEIVDNAIVVLIPGAMDAAVTTMLGSPSIDMGGMERLEAWLKADEECPPVLYRPAKTVSVPDDDDLGRGFAIVHRELRRVGRLMLELSKKLDALRM